MKVLLEVSLRHSPWLTQNKGIRCNAVFPGGTETNIMQNSAVEMNMTGYPALAPYHKCMPGSSNKAEELANAILFLATAPSVNGAELAVDKGWLTC
jgi:NAD(P)-dependent dehydrogenase (short-subunit alcohol dehydrogenase family)